jgi:hypothetical protein
MHQAIKTISTYGIPTNSATRAIQYLGEKEDYTSEQYFSMIVEITGHGINIADPRLTKYTFLYLIQDIIKTSFNTDNIDMTSLILSSSDKAEKFIAENPWVFAVPDEVVKVDDAGKPKRKKGAKQEEALRIYKENISEGKPKIIELFMSELDMSKAGATTYFYNTKKKVE